MSLLSASIRAPVAPLSLHYEVSGVGGSVKSVSPKAAPPANLSRRYAQESFKKASVHTTRRKFCRVSRYA